MNGFKLYFNDNTIFEGQSMPKSDWRKAPDKQITKIELSIGDRKLTLTGYNQYNHLHENVAILGKGQGVRKLLIMARTNIDTLIIEFDFQNASINKRVVNHGEEYGHFKTTDKIIGYDQVDKSPIFEQEFIGQILTGWKKGIEIENPTYKLDKIIGV